MFAPWNISCPVNILRGQLKHTWLENQVCNKSADDVANLWRTKSWDNVIGEIFPYRIEQSRQLINDMVSGFSPAQLVDQLGPLQNLPNKSRSRLKDVLHNAYLESSRISTLSELLSRELENFTEEFAKFRTVWNTERTDANKMALREAWQQLQKSGDALLAVFETLPKGVVLP